MTKLRVLAVDDEALALDRLTRLLEEIDGVEVVAAMTSGEAALDAIAKLRPDLLILDIEMPKLDGFDVVDGLIRKQSGGAEPTPLIAFVTAYPQFALQAFETGALDFVCKPVRAARLELTIERARLALERQEAADRLRELEASLAGLRESTAYVDRDLLWIRNKGDMVRVDPDEIDWIESEGQYARLHLGDRTFLIRNSLNSLAERLAGEGHVQVHRSALVNSRKVKSVKATRLGTKLVLNSGTEIRVGRTYRQNLRSALGMLSDRSGGATEAG